MTEAGYCRVLLDKKDTKIMKLESEITKLRIEYEKQIVKLQEENAELKSDNEARKFAMAMSEKVEKQLREENAELKDKNKALEQYADLADVKVDEVKNKLTKATELLKHWASSYSGVDIALCKQTQQFLNSEVEK